MSENPAPGPKKPRSRRGYDSALVQSIERRIHSPELHDRYIEPELLADALEEAYRLEPLSQDIHKYLCDFLRGKIKVPKGRRPSLKERERNNFILTYYDLFLHWLSHRDDDEFASYEQYLTKEAEGRPHYEQAAFMTLEALKERGDFPTIDYRQVISYASASRIKVIKESKAQLKREQAKQKRRNQENSQE